MAREAPVALEARPAREVGLALLFALLWVAVLRPGPLDTPFFWDEADVYAPGAKWVAEHGLNVTPGVFDDDYSRGHPPLLYLLAGAAFLLFGATPAVGHLVVLPFTALALAGTYLLGAWGFDRRVGIAAALLLATTPLFMSVGNMLLPEVPLTALSVLALALFARGRLGWAVALGVAMVWTKETGIFAAAAIGVGVLVDQHQRGRWRARPIALATVPLWALGAFFVWQKLNAGYFVFPHHANLLADRPLELVGLLTVWPSLIGWHLRGVVVAGALAAVALGLRRRQRPASPRPTRRAVVAACLALVLFNAAFFTKMFWLERYALPAHPGLLVVLSAAILWGFDRLGALARPTVRWGLIGVAAFAGVLGLRAEAPRDAEEQTFAYVDVIETHRVAFAALEEDDAPVLTSWPMTVELKEPWLGYVEAPVEVIHERHAPEDARAGSMLVNSGSWRADELRDRARSRGMHRAYTVKIGVAPALELFRR